MQVSIETVGELQRRLTIQIPAARVDQEVDSRLHSMMRTARVDGFRPGKVPFSVIQRKFAGRVRDEVVAAVIESSYRDALAQHQLQVAGDPRIEQRPSQPGQDLEYIALVEIYPQIAAVALDGITVEKPVAEVTDQDVTAMVEVLRRQRTVWREVTRPAQTGDRIIINYSVGMGGDDKPFLREQQTPVVIGSNSVLAGFEDHLAGVAAGGKAEFTLNYPAQHPNANLAGKPAHFQVDVISVAEPQLPELNEDFAREFGVTTGGMEALRREVAANMQRELSLAIKGRIKDQVLNGLLTTNPVQAPAALVDQEIDRLLEQARAGEQAGTAGAVPSREQLHDQAMRRVSLGLLIGQLVRQYQLNVDAARVRSLIETIASSYEEPEQVIQWYYGDRNLLSGIEAVVMEDMVVDTVLQHANVREVPSSFQALMHPGQSS